MSSHNFWDARSTTERICDHPQCGKEGLHRAPKSPKTLRDYYWFCLDHVREYNAAWNYCQGMSPNQIDQMVKDTHCWDRPTWPMGMMGATASDGFTVEDDLGAFVKNRGHGGSHYRRNTMGKANGLTPNQEKALALFQLKLPLDSKELKEAYKRLARAHHPDLNPDRIDATEKLKEINAAYDLLRPLSAKKTA